MSKCEFTQCGTSFGECAICLENMCRCDGAKNTVCLPCGHQFHEECVEGIILSPSVRNVCPLCRADFPKDAKRWFHKGNLYFRSLQIEEHTLESDLTLLEQSILQQAIAFWLEAANQGHTGAMGNIALLTKRGLGLNQSDSETFIWLSRAAKLGLQCAQADLAYFNQYGIGTPVNITEAVKWYTLAAQPKNELGLQSLFDLKMLCEEHGLHLNHITS